MTIKEMHYDFKKKLNKVDSQQNRNLRVPEVDWVLNEAAEVFVKRVAMPYVQSKRLGFESDQRSIDDIRLLVRDGNDVANQLSVVNNLVVLPVDYWHRISSYALLSKGSCSNIRATLFMEEHDDMFEESYFDRSSFEWREVNGVFTQDGIRVFDDGSFSIDKIGLSYIRKMAYMYNASSYPGGTYTDINGTVLTGVQNCELPFHTHREIVDLAVLITTGEIDPSQYNIKMAKVAMT